MMSSKPTKLTALEPLILATSLSCTSYAGSEDSWGVAAMYRISSVPFLTQSGDSYVGSFVPMIFFENDYVYIDGMEGGVFLYEDDRTNMRISAITRLRFLDIPKSLQNDFNGDSADFGLQARYTLSSNWYSELELMIDDEYQPHSNFRLAAHYKFENWDIKPSATLRYKSSDFNSEYYSFKDLGGSEIGSGVDFNLGIEARYHLISNLYLLAEASATRLDSNAYGSDIVEDRYQGEVLVGFGFFGGKQRQYDLKARPYLRVAHGWASPSNMGEIFAFDYEPDEYDNQATSLFYGHPLSDELFGLPLEIYLTPGLVHHWASDVQRPSTEYVMAIKAYYAINWPVKWRFGIAEGLSYIDEISYIERVDIEKKGYKPNKLLNYLDFSFDVNIGSLLRQKDWENLWLGYSLHHRSAIFETASQFGRIKGGSNYNMVYFQYDF